MVMGKIFINHKNEMVLKNYIILKGFRFRFLGLWEIYQQPFTSLQNFVKMKEGYTILKIFENGLTIFFFYFQYTFSVHLNSYNFIQKISKIFYYIFNFRLFHITEKKQSMISNRIQIRFFVVCWKYTNPQFFLQIN